ncbi:PREDICTED: receptor-type tyrosine-protein phosphatase F-like [Atta cephalotes]|uniref:protein-tyrosine-phosphatase n=1 Tax=Atta cephalotes TaxID=12957 RepID=A0A158N972_ATTCE|nr:PREDICTED: receptor-type tyrosine-protein phosphatase F-like [Atta cephalotes]
MNALMFFIFVSHVLHIFGKVTVLRGPLLSTRPDKIKLRCLSEDDGGALVWNYNLIWHYYQAEKNNLQFRDIIGFNNNAINCKMNANVSCLKAWTKKNDWYLTNSLKTPMGPVFDQRWEDTYYVNKLAVEVKLSFSVRASHDAHILICNGTNYLKDSCYWIIIGGWHNTLSVLRKCATGVPLLGEFPAAGSKCREPLVSFKHKPLSENEWRTFIITWNSIMRRIIVYDTDKIIMTYVDKEESSNDNYHMFIRSITAMLFRFHIYDFLHTTVENAILTSPVFQFNNRTMCIQLLIGLCAECEASIVLHDFTNNDVFVMVTAKGSKAIHGLPTWQSVKIKINSSALDYNTDSKMIIELIPKLNKYSSNPLWAIANVRQCSQNADTDTYCPEGKIGPQCLFSCTHHLSSNSDCKGTELCYEDGSCNAYTYGYGCMKTCGSCFYNEQCNKANGECSKGCNNNSEKTNIKYIEQPWNELFRNMTQLTGNFENLEPGVIYHIGLILDITGIKIHSDWQVAETKCNPVENFNITSKENSITINWQLNPTQLYSCPINWYHLTVYKIDTSMVVSSLTPTSFEYELEYLPSYTSFEVNIYHKNHKLFSQEIHTLEGVPSKVSDLQSMLSANTELILIWRAPLEPNGKIEKYEVFLKVEEYFGCKNLKISILTNHTIINSITNVPTITIRDLHPYRSYSAQVRAYNSRHFSMFAETTFKTAQSEIPSELFNQLTIQNWKLSWSPPEDCTTISGALKARIRIHGISDAVKYFNITKQTSRNYIDLSGLDPKLNGLERYMATVYVIREFMSKENASAYKKIEFETPSTAPPEVTNLEIVEIDTRQNLIHLRWQSPLPPLNGKLRIYGVQLCDTYSKHCSDIQVQFNEFCDLWDDYISVTIENKSSNTKFVEVHTPSTAVFDGVLDMIDKFDSTILLNIPFVINDTQDSMMYVIIKGHNPCEQYLKIPEKLRTRAGIKINEIAWLAAEVSTSEFAGKQFTIGDNYIYGNAKNCPLKSKGYYDIVIIVTDRNLFTESIMLSRSVLIGEVPPKHHEAWLISVILLLVVAGVAFYLYRRKKQKLTEQLMQDEMILSQNIENFEQETKSSISNSKQNLSTSSDRQSLSQTIIPEVSIAANNNEEKTEMSSLVKVKDFENYVRQAIQSGLLDKQYETFSRGQTKPWDYGKLPQNKSKNRYGNLIAYDETRVILKKLPDDGHSDYINANYITGYKKDKHYIATQGPKPNTVIDFWRMIWQENVLIICMLTNVIESGKTKCEQYWPDIGKKKKYGDIIVLNAKHNVFADYCFRIFNVTCGKETRKIEHLHYTAWPDHSVPLYTHSIVTYLKKLLATPPGIGPVVVHCSAGVGRTGTIILCDICLRRAAAEGLVDVFAETTSIRSERANMVDNKQQYLLAHLALVECLLSIPTTLPCNEMLLIQIKALKKQLPLHQQRLQNTAWQDEALRQITSPPSLSECNRVKNRFPELISDRIYLKRYPASDEDSDYLSAVYVDGVKVQNQYLASQLPMPSTINDFWRMIAEFKVELILMLQPPDFQNPTCCAIAPTSGEFKPVPYLNIIMKEVVELEYYTSQKLLLIDSSEKPSREQFVTILCLTEWKPGKNQLPPPVITMVTLWQAAERIARGDGPTVTLCHDGVTGCGLYLALSFLLERMAVERECDVSLAVRAVRRSRPDFVHSLVI